MNMHTYLFQLLEQMVEFVGDYVGDHGTTLGNIEDILLVVLEWRANKVVAKLCGTKKQWVKSWKI